jgi:hypothetical protein
MQRQRMRRAGIKFRPVPRPSRLTVLPCRFMVLSAILQTAWATSMSGKTTWTYPLTTWVDALGGVRGLKHPLCPVLPQHRKPPDPFSFSPPIDGEGEASLETKPIINQLSVEELAAFSAFEALSALSTDDLNVGTTFLNMSRIQSAMLLVHNHLA